MPTFTVISNNRPTLGVEGDCIHSVVRGVKEAMLLSLPKNHTVSTDLSIITRGKEGRYHHEVFHLATLSLRNVRKRVLSTTLVYGEQPMVASQQYHANDHRVPITCKKCGHSLFYNYSRSLDYENHACAHCLNPAHTLTETGASA